MTFVDSQQLIEREDVRSFVHFLTWINEIRIVEVLQIPKQGEQHLQSLTVLSGQEL